MSPPVVVGVDGSPSASGAVRVAAAEARRRGAALRLVAAVVWMADGAPGTTTWSPAERRLLTATAEDHLAAARSEALRAAPEVSVACEVRGGDAATVLLAVAAEAALLVVGSRGRGGVAGLLLGSVAVTVAARAPCPVVVARRAEVTAPDAPVVVGVDPTGGVAALEFAVEEAAGRAAPLVAVHALGRPVVDPFLAATWHPERVAAEERQRLTELVDRRAGTAPEIEIRVDVPWEEPAAALVRRSRQAGLVVVGARGRGGAAGLFLGSVSQVVLREAHSPVAVVGPAASGTGG